MMKRERGERTFNLESIFATISARFWDRPPEFEFEEVDLSDSEDDGGKKEVEEEEREGFEREDEEPR